MIFLCNPLSFEDIGMGWFAVFLVMIFFFGIWNPIFFSISYVMKNKGLIREFIFRKIQNEFSWVWGIFAVFALAVPTYSPIFFLPIILAFFFPLYFTFNFIILLLKKELLSKEMLSKLERNFLLVYYGGISFLIIILGIAFKLKLHGGFSNLIYYYVADIGKVNFLVIFFIVALMFLIFWYTSEIWVIDPGFFLSKGTSSGKEKVKD